MARKKTVTVSVEDLEEIKKIALEILALNSEEKSEKARSDKRARSELSQVDRRTSFY